MSSSGSLPTLLHETADELFRVLLQHLVDLVEDRVHVVVEPFLALGGILGRLDLGDLFLGRRTLRLLVLLPAVLRHGTHLLEPQWKAAQPAFYSDPTRRHPQ